MRLGGSLIGELKRIVFRPAPAMTRAVVVARCRGPHCARRGRLGLRAYVWLCSPQQAKDPCDYGLTETVIDADSTRGAA